MLDAQTAIYVWSGKDTLRMEEFERLRAICGDRVHRLALNRFPTPTVLTLVEGDSMCRFVESRLIPLQNDIWAEQVQSLPELARLNSGAATLLRRFPKTDEFSYRRYVRFLQTV